MIQSTLWKSFLLPIKHIWYSSPVLQSGTNLHSRPIHTEMPMNTIFLVITFHRAPWTYLRYFHKWEKATQNKHKMICCCFVDVLGCSAHKQRDQKTSSCTTRWCSAPSVTGTAASATREGKLAWAGNQHGQPGHTQTFGATDDSPYTALLDTAFPAKYSWRSHHTSEELYQIYWVNLPSWKLEILLQLGEKP